MRTKQTWQTSSLSKELAKQELDHGQDIVIGRGFDMTWRILCALLAIMSQTFKPAKLKMTTTLVFLSPRNPFNQKPWLAASALRCAHNVYWSPYSEFAPSPDVSCKDIEIIEFQGTWKWKCLLLLRPCETSKSFSNVNIFYDHDDLANKVKAKLMTCIKGSDIMQLG